MHTLRLVIEILWAVFWIGWLASAFTAKRSVSRGPGFLRTRGLAAIAVVIIVRGFHGAALTVNSPVLGAIGAAMFAAGLGLALWARVVMGRNWGMPMSQKQDPELVTSGPFRFIRHPIYSGILLAILGTALVTNLIAIAIAMILGAYFIYSATIEERNLVATFPDAYPAYRAHTKKLIPFVI